MKHIKRFEKVFEDMSYTTIFGNKISHNEALEKRIRDNIVSIIVDELGISEKSFKQYDNVIEEVKQLCNDNPEIYEKSQKYYENNKRLELLAELMYDKYFGYNKIEMLKVKLKEVEN